MLKLSIATITHVTQSNEVSGLYTLYVLHITIVCRIKLCNDETY